MSGDIEMETWRRQWQTQDAPLPDLRAKVRRQNQHKTASLTLLVACLAGATGLALAGRADGRRDFAFGLWLTVLVVGGFAWRTSRGAWSPAVHVPPPAQPAEPRARRAPGRAGRGAHRRSRGQRRGVTVVPG